MLSHNRLIIVWVHVHGAEELPGIPVCCFFGDDVEELAFSRHFCEIWVVFQVHAEWLSTESHDGNRQVVLFNFLLFLKRLLVLQDEVLDSVGIRANQADNPLVRAEVNIAVDCFSLIFNLLLPS